MCEKRLRQADRVHSHQALRLLLPCRPLSLQHLSPPESVRRQLGHHPDLVLLGLGECPGACPGHAHHTDQALVPVAQRRKAAEASPASIASSRRNG